MTSDFNVALAARSVAEAAEPAADEVDRDSRLPVEALAAAREHELMGAMVPVALGGHGASLDAIAQATTRLAYACSNTGMVFAMHQIQVACLVKHGDTPELREFTRRVAAEQLLLGSATTELATGGDVTRSSCAVDGGRLAKNAPVISYGEASDAILVTARRDPQAAAGDQVLVVCERAHTELEATGTWDAFGFRGTASRGYQLQAEVVPGMTLTTPYSDISSETMLPVSHILWSAVWLGIAEAAATKARRYVQKAARANPGVTPPAALRVAELEMVVQRLRDTRDAALARYARTGGESTIADAVAMNMVKVNASELVVECVHKALLITGISGYREDSPWRMGRLLRDAHGAALMVSNERILANNAQLLLVSKGV